MSDDRPSPRAPVPEQRTLFRASLDAGAVHAEPAGKAGRHRTARRAERTSDTTRFRFALVAALTGAAASAIAAFAFPPPGGHAAPGPLSRPHANAKLECSSCHKPQDNTVAADACAGCHGNHGSVRAGHAKALATRAMRCSRNWSSRPEKPAT